MANYNALLYICRDEAILSFITAEWEEKGVSWACRASELCDRTFARYQQSGQQQRYGHAASRQGGPRAPLLGNDRHRSSYQGKCYDYLYHRFIKRSCPCACHDGTLGSRSKAPLIPNLGSI